MIRRDFVLRVLQQAALALRRLVGLRKAGRLEEAKAAAREACRTLLGVDLGLLSSLPFEALRDLLSIERGQAPGRCLLAAELLAEEAARLEAQGPAAAAAALKGKAEGLRAWVGTLPAGTEYLAAADEWRAGL